MTDYALLVLPAANRVYADATSRLLRHELAVLGNLGMDVELRDLTETRIGGVEYVGFSTASPLTDDDLAVLSNASAAYALFEVIDAGEQGRVLRPVALTPRDRFDTDLLTIQKYTGKTNELFTRLLVNLTCMALDEPRAMLTQRLRLLDPLCGRGTTLNQAMMYGFDATGIEMDGKDFEAYERFIKTWLRTKRFKHTADSGMLRKNKQRLGQRLDITYAPTKEQFKAGETNTLSYRGTDTFQVDELFPPRSFDMIVTDAPYGVQHGSHREADLARSPRDLLAAAVPVWLRVLRPGGALGISWNVKVLPREELAAILRKSGLEVHDGPPFDGFVHRVDQAIERDLLVASLPR